jgi:hypothetical protein
MHGSETQVKLAKLIGFAVAWVLCLGVALGGLAQTPQSCGSDPVDFAQKFLRAIYPEVSEKGGYMYLSASGPFKRNWSILSEYSVLVKEYADDDAPAGIIEAHGSRPFVNVELAGAFLMCNQEGIYKFAGGGSITGRDRWEEFRKVADTHPEWTDEQAIAALKAAGARYYGPDQKDAFLKQVPLAALSTYIGKFELKSTEFVVYQEEGEHPRYDMSWILDLETLPAPTKRQVYTLFFEPFRGKLYLLSTMGPEPIKPANGPAATPLPK